MTIYKFTLTTSKGGFQANESYVSPDVSPESFVRMLQRWIEARTACLPDSVEILRIRIGQYSSRQRSRPYRPGQHQPFAGTEEQFDLPERGRFPIGGNSDNIPDQARSSLLVAYGYGGDRQTNRYLPWIPDAVIGTDPNSYVPAGNAGWVAQFSAFANEVVNSGWVIYARDRTGAFPVLNILDWVQSETAPSNLGVVVPTLSAGSFVPGNRLQISGVTRSGTDKLSYNGTYYIHSINTTQQPGNSIIYLRKTESGDPATVKKPGKVQAKGWGFFPIQSMNGVAGVAHKRGNRSVSPRGRVQRRASLDP